MPAKILLVSVGLRENGDREQPGHGLGQCPLERLFHSIFQDDWGPRDLFRKLFLLAAECRDDAAMPMRDVVVCLKDAPRETNPEVLAFRRELEERTELRVLRYGSADEMRARLTEVCEGWARDIIAAPPAHFAA